MPVRIEQKSYKWLIVVAGIIIAGLVFFYINEQQTSSPNYKGELVIQTYHSGTGWGYSIAAGKHVVIKQPYIPAVQGMQAFKTEQQARKTARLVIQKIKMGDIPMITRDELDSLGIEIK